MTDCVRRAFWDSLKQRLESTPPDYSQALSLLEEVKQVSVYVPYMQSVQLHQH